MHLCTYAPMHLCIYAPQMLPAPRLHRRCSLADAAEAKSDFPTTPTSLPTAQTLPAPLFNQRRVSQAVLDENIDRPDGVLIVPLSAGKTLRPVVVAAQQGGASRLVSRRLSGTAGLQAMETNVRI